MNTTGADYKMIFETAPLLILLLSPELRVIGATDAYLAATLRKREDIMGMVVYDVFPDNPDDPNPQGVASLKATFNRVLTNKVPDAMGELKYDIPREDGTYESRYWTTMNTPVLDKDNNVLHIINQVVDITDYVVVREKSKHNEQVANELKEKTANMEGEIYLRAQQLQAANEKMSSANEELNTTKHKLLAANEELSVQQEELQASHEELRVQQEEIVMINDELVKNNEILEKARLALLLKAEQLERSSSFKTDFLSNMSHELRTPLNSMLILSKLLSNNKHQNLTEKQVEQAIIINKSGNDLLTLINDILDLTKIEAGKIEMVVEETPVSHVVIDMEELFSSIAMQKGVKFTTMVAGDIPTHIRTDKFRLEQILKNLLSNAFKFTDSEGTVTLSVSIAAPVLNKRGSIFEQYAQVVRFAVADTGIGIPANKQSDIFEAFKQADGGTSRKYGGTGLGLSISKQLALLLGGEIQLESEVGKGSTFSIYLPATYVANADDNDGTVIETPAEGSVHFPVLNYNSIPVEPSPRIREQLRGKTVLITDDDDRTLKALTMVLSEYDLNLLKATNGKEALAILDGHDNIDMVLMDVVMHEMDGYQTVLRIKQNQLYSKIPIIMLTAINMQGEQQKYIAAGVSDYLQKPIDVQHLLAVMEIWLKDKKQVPR